MSQETTAHRAASGRQCAHIRCRNVLAPQATGRPARFCSTACRQADHRGRRAAAEAAGRLDAGARELKELFKQTVRALGGIVDFATSDSVPGWRSPGAAGREAHELLERLERAAEDFRYDRRTAAVYGLAQPATAPAR